MKKHIPNILTCLNLLSGCIGVLMALKGDITSVTYCVLASGVFDFFDGMVARWLHVKSNIGKELDSLADMVSFGFLPGTILYVLLSESIPHHAIIPYAAYIVTIFSALRLAKFNIDERQTSDFIGLNTPMNTFYVLSLPYISERYPDIIHNTLFLIASILITSYLLVSEIRLFSMKFSSFNWYENKFRYIFLLAVLFLFASFRFMAVPLILVLYFALSVIHFRKRREP